MDRVTFPSESWILICDGSKALLFRNAGDERALNLKAEHVLLEPHLPTHELGTDRPGRAYDAMDGSRSAMEETDWHREAEAKFLQELAKKLDVVVRERKVRHLAIVASPKALGVLRDQLTPSVRAVVSAELAKDLVKLPTPEIERHLSAMGELK